MNKESIVHGLLISIEHWMPKVENIEQAAEIMGINPKHYGYGKEFRFNLNTFNDQIKISRLWFAYQLAEQLREIEKVIK